MNFTEHNVVMLIVFGGFEEFSGFRGFHGYLEISNIVRKASQVVFQSFESCRGVNGAITIPLIFALKCLESLEAIASSPYFHHPST